VRPGPASVHRHTCSSQAFRLDSRADAMALSPEKRDVLGDLPVLLEPILRNGRVQWAKAGF
jgi:hypothetical protein